MRKIIFFCIFCVSVTLANGQNLISNPSFEIQSRCPRVLGDFYATDWYSIARNSSPDLYSTHANFQGSANPNWYYCKVEPYLGSSFAGIVLGCKKDTYREYITTLLTEKLVMDSVYLISIALAYPYMSLYQIESLDIILSVTAMYSHDGYDIIEQEASFSINLDSLKTDGSWNVYTFEYISNGNERYLNIGNFKSKKKTKFKKIPDRNEFAFKKMYNSAYICIDNVNLYKLNSEYVTYDSLLVEKETIIDSLDYKKNEPIILNNINFDTDKSKLNSYSFIELDKIVNYLMDNPEITIEIRGHTDNVGNEEHNLRLSEERAKSVADYLILKGVESDRILYKGYGSSSPIVSNNNGNNRQQNRRVEIVIRN